MPPNSKPKQDLGKSLIRDRFKGKNIQRKSTEDLIIPIDPKKIPKNVGSITEQKNLDEFLSTAELANSQFTAEKVNAQVIVSANNIVNSQVALLSNVTNDYLLNMEFKNFLRIPKRPCWDADTSRAQLESKEKESFLNWRRAVALFQEENNIVMTPYEKNLEMWRQLWRVVEKSHLLVQIVDARNPLFFYCEDLREYQKTIHSSKRHLLLINKADFLTEQQRMDWLHYFHSIKVDCLFYSADLALKEALSTQPISLPIKRSSTSIVCRNDLLEIFDEYYSSYYVEEPIFMIGMVGYPNVGKSSTINSLLGAKKAAVASTPGKTKHFQTLFLRDDLCLCDCPGLVFPNFATTKAELLVNGVLPIDQMRDFFSPVTLITARLPRLILERLYGISLPRPIDEIDLCRRPTASELLSTYANARGFKTSGVGNPDEARASRYILKDYVQGKLLFCYPPPNYPADAFAFNARNEYSHARLIDIGNISEGGNNSIDKQSMMKLTDMDIQFFDQSTVKAHTLGKFENRDFSGSIGSHSSGPSGLISSKKHFKKNRQKP